MKSGFKCDIIYIDKQRKNKKIGKRAIELQTWSGQPKRMHRSFMRCLIEYGSQKPLLLTERNLSSQI